MFIDMNLTLVVSIIIIMLIVIGVQIYGLLTNNDNVWNEIIYKLFGESL